ncbi:hypothetical protein N9N22_03050 [Alphaproteobacteria bacterium]|nr:hypothetical protein [Alphaproteobacteria bacterium]
MHLIIGWQVWKFIRLNAKRLFVVGGGFVFVAYANGEFERLLILAGSTRGQFVLIIFKNLAYLGLLAIFFLWPFLFKPKDREPKLRETVTVEPEEPGKADEPFDFIRKQGGIRRRSEIIDDIIKKNK